MKNSAARPPAGLSAEARAWWRRLVADYAIEDPAGLLLLQSALEARDRMAECQRAITRDGAAVRDRWGQIKPHPLLPAERDNRAAMLAALKALNLDLEPLKERPGRR